MFDYIFKPFHKHIDDGFGVTADAFRNAADRLVAAEKSATFLNKDLPICFLYRHAIELYLKSLIVVVHRSLRIQFGDDSPDSEPKLMVGDKWRALNRIHGLRPLFGYLTALLEENKEALEKAGRTDWSTLPTDLSAWIGLIEDTDPSSTLFRYPTTRDPDADRLKSSSKEASVGEIFAQMGPDGKYVRAYIASDENDEVVESYQLDDAPLDSVRDALTGATDMLSGIHAGMRVELAGGR